MRRAQVGVDAFAEPRRAVRLDAAEKLRAARAGAARAAAAARAACSAPSPSTTDARRDCSAAARRRPRPAARPTAKASLPSAAGTPIEALASIEQVHRRLAFGAEGLDQALIEAPVGIPVEMAEVVAGRVGLVVGELEPARLRWRARPACCPGRWLTLCCAAMRSRSSLRKKLGRADGAQGGGDVSGGGAWRHRAAVGSGRAGRCRRRARRS